MERRRESGEGGNLSLHFLVLSPFLCSLAARLSQVVTALITITSFDQTLPKLTLFCDIVKMCKYATRHWCNGAHSYFCKRHQSADLTCVVTVMAISTQNRPSVGNLFWAACCVSGHVSELFAGAIISVVNGGQDLCPPFLTWLFNCSPAGRPFLSVLIAPTLLTATYKFGFNNQVQPAVLTHTDPYGNQLYSPRRRH